MAVCPVCGAKPCYRICPTQDPYQGDQARENEDYEFNARYDDVRERYAATAADAEIDAAAEEAWSKDHPDDDAPLDGNEDDYGDPPMPASLQSAVIANPNLMREQASPVNSDDIPF